MAGFGICYTFHDIVRWTLKLILCELFTIIVFSLMPEIYYLKLWIEFTAEILVVCHKTVILELNAMFVL